MIDLNLYSIDAYDAWIITTNHHQIDIRFYTLNRWHFDRGFGYDYYYNTLLLGFLTVRKYWSGRKVYHLPTMQIEISVF